VFSAAGLRVSSPKAAAALGNDGLWAPGRDWQLLGGRARECSCAPGDQTEAFWRNGCGNLIDLEGTGSLLAVMVLETTMVAPPFHGRGSRSAPLATAICNFGQFVAESVAITATAQCLTRCATLRRRCRHGCTVSWPPKFDSYVAV